MKQKILKDLHQLFKQWSGKQADKIEELPAHGSYRTYFRIFSGEKTIIGAYNEDKAENRAFLTFPASLKMRECQYRKYKPRMTRQIFIWSKIWGMKHYSHY